MSGPGAAWCQRSDGTRHGPYVEWHDKHRKTVEGGYRNGRRDGAWRHYFVTGQLSRRELYQDGVLLESRSFELVDGI